MGSGVSCLLLDQGLPCDAASILRDAGVPCRHVGELGMAAASDSDILERAGVDGCVVVTLDADFHAMLALRRATKPSVVRIRLQGLDGVALARIVQSVLDRYEEELISGALITVKANKTTCHRLLPS